MRDVSAGNPKLDRIGAGAGVCLCQSVSPRDPKRSPTVSFVVDLDLSRSQPPKQLNSASHRRGDPGPSKACASPSDRV